MNKLTVCLVCLCIFFASCTSSDTTPDSQSTANTTNNTKVKMILDLDTGIDDAMALAYALGTPQIELIGIVGTFGNVNMEDGVQNTLNLLEILNRTDIPVYKGATHSITNSKVYIAAGVSKFIHGDNGLGSVKLEKAKRSAENGDGVDFIIESARKYGKDLVIVATGPMTNIAEALKREPKLKEMVADVIIMGGALTVPGNINHYSEANIYQDPVAANKLFTSGTPLTMVGLDITLRTNLTKTETQSWRELGTKSGKVYADIVDYYIDAYGVSAPELKGCALHDPLAVAIAIHPDFVETISMFMIVGTSNEDWGRTIGDTGKLNDENPNVKVCIDVDQNKFVSHFMETLTELFKMN